MGGSRCCNTASINTFTFTGIFCFEIIFISTTAPIIKLSTAAFQRIKVPTIYVVTTIANESGQLTSIEFWKTNGYYFFFFLYKWNTWNHFIGYGLTSFWWTFTLTRLLCLVIVSIGTTTSIIERLTCVFGVIKIPPWDLLITTTPSNSDQTFF